MNATIEHLTTLVTAFQTWAEMEAALKGGYVPTLLKSESNPPSWNKAVRALRYQLRARGYRVWPEQLAS